MKRFFKLLLLASALFAVNRVYADVGPVKMLEDRTLTGTPAVLYGQDGSSNPVCMPIKISTSGALITESVGGSSVSGSTVSVNNFELGLNGKSYFNSNWEVTNTVQAYESGYWKSWEVYSVGGGAKFQVNAGSTHTVRSGDAYGEQTDFIVHAATITLFQLDVGATAYIRISGVK